MSTVHAIVDDAVIEHQPAVVKEVRAPAEDSSTVAADGAVGQSQRAKVEDAAAGGASGIATPNS